MLLAPNKKLYFLSDFHLGSPNHAESSYREKIIVNFLKSIQHDAGSIFIIGDIFDFWYEYKTVVPKGCIRLLGVLAELADKGINIHIFKGNHDLWLKDYLSSEFRVDIYNGPHSFEYNGFNFFIAHGDGLGKGDNRYKFLKKIFTNSICQKLFKLIHPDLGIPFANYFSRISRKKNNEAKYLGAENEWLIQYSLSKLDTAFHHFYIYGHRHYPVDYILNSNSRYINLGDWMKHYSYAVFDGQNLSLNYYTLND